MSTEETDGEGVNTTPTVSYSADSTIVAFRRGSHAGVFVDTQRAIRISTVRSSQPRPDFLRMGSIGNAA